ncbi:MAG: hypothetical protein ACJASB_001376 [Shewanella psychromarinicola]|jgi:hypothetical protein
MIINIEHFSAKGAMLQPQSMLTADIAILILIVIVYALRIGKSVFLKRAKY